MNKIGPQRRGQVNRDIYQSEPHYYLVVSLIFLHFHVACKWTTSLSKVNHIEDQTHCRCCIDIVNHLGVLKLTRRENKVSFTSIWLFYTDTHIQNLYSPPVEPQKILWATQTSVFQNEVQISATTKLSNWACNRTASLHLPCKEKSKMNPESKTTIDCNFNSISLQRKHTMNFIHIFLFFNNCSPRWVVDLTK